MPDKEIIADSIDVSECEFLWKEKLPKRFCNNGNLDCDCNSNLNCYYKQFKRKEQECERLSSLIRETEIYSDVCCECRDEILIYPTISGRNDYTQIEVEERSLKKIIRQLDQLKAENKYLKEEKQGLIKDWEEKKNLAYETACKNEKLKQTLTEIKFLVRELLKRTGQVVPYEIKQILQKISEVVE